MQFKFVLTKNTKICYDTLITITVKCDEIWFPALLFFSIPGGGGYRDRWSRIACIKNEYNAATLKILYCNTLVKQKLFKRCLKYNTHVNSKTAPRCVLLQYNIPAPDRLIHVVYNYRLLMWFTRDHKDIR